MKHLKPNGHNNLYIVASSWESYQIDRVWRNRDQYDSLTEAKKIARLYIDQTVYKVHFDKHSGDVVYIMEVRK